MNHRTGHSKIIKRMLFHNREQIINDFKTCTLGFQFFNYFFRFKFKII